MTIRGFFLLAAITGLTCGQIGCSQTTTDAKVTFQREGQSKLDAMKMLAEAIEKKDQTGISNAIETLTASVIDVKAQADLARELVELYKSKVKGKLKGDQAAQVQNVIDNLQKELK